MRSFIAIEVSDDIKEKAILISKKFEGSGITSVKPNAFHITLFFFEDANEQQINDIKLAMDNLKCPPFAIELKGVSLFDPKRPRVVFIDIRGGTDYIRKIYDQLKKTLPTEEHEFKPHLTIARIRDQRNNEKIIKIAEELSDVEIGRFTASSIKLIKSTLTSDGPLYDLLYEVKL